MAKVLISDKLSERAIDIFRERGLEVDFKPGLSVEEQMAIIGDYDGLAIRSATKVTAEMLAAAPNLNWLGAPVLVLIMWIFRQRPHAALLS